MRTGIESRHRWWNNTHFGRPVHVRGVRQNASFHYKKEWERWVFSPIRTPFHSHLTVHKQPSAFASSSGKILKNKLRHWRYERPREKKNNKRNSKRERRSTLVRLLAFRSNVRPLRRSLSRRLTVRPARVGRYADSHFSHRRDGNGHGGDPLSHDQLTDWEKRYSTPDRVSMPSGTGISRRAAPTRGAC